MTRDDDTVSAEIEAPVSFVIRRVADEGAQGRARGKFMRGGCGEVGVASATESTKIMIGGLGAVESKEGCAHG
jgi:hypothetical protein